MVPLGIVFCLLLMLSLPLENWFRLILWLLAASPFISRTVDITARSVAFKTLTLNHLPIVVLRSNMKASFTLPFQIYTDDGIHPPVTGA
jgi:hypothetical protein